MKKGLLVFACSFMNILIAQQKGDTIPGNPFLVSTSTELEKLMSLEKKEFKYSVEDYFKKPAQFKFKLSGNGQYLSYIERDSGGKNILYVKNTITKEIKKVIEEKVETISEYNWLPTNKIIYTQDNGGDENYHVFTIDIDGNNKRNWTPFPSVRVEILKILKNEPAIIVLMNKDNPEIFEPYKINFETGSTVKLFKNTDQENPIMSYDFDKDGNLKAYTKQHNKIEEVLFYKKENQLFEKTIKTTWKDTFSIISFNYATPDPHDAYLLTNLNSNTTEIVLYDFQKNKIIERLFCNEDFDIDNLTVSENRGYEIDYYTFDGEKEVNVPVSENYKRTDSKIRKKFENKSFKIINVTDKEDKYLLFVYSDKIKGIYYLYDVIKDKFEELINMAPYLLENEMAEIRPIQFLSRDGIILNGYLTIPQGTSKLNKVPLIVNPHGGPYGERDDWSFNTETQLFASRGYATIQINYRGSGGFGKTFLLAGNKQIGRKMLNDLEDGVKYAKSLGFIKDDKIAIYGASYGGLATLGSLVKTPDLYTCGVSYIGVSNLFTFFDSFPPYWKPFLGQVYEQWYNPNNVADKKIMKDVSPALNSDKIKKPLFVVQGANDPRVNINESDQIVSNLRKKGLFVPYMVKYNEGHGFHREENQIELYKCMMGFFADNLK